MVAAVIYALLYGDLLMLLKRKLVRIIEINPIHHESDEFFDDLDDDGNKDKGDKITVTIPLEMKDQKEDIKSIIEEALSDYSGIKVK